MTTRERLDAEFEKCPNMRGNPVKDLLAFDRNLQEGQMARARWTNSHNYYEAVGRIVKINPKSVRMVLTEVAPPYPSGFTVSVPRVRNYTQWTPNNGINPV